MQSSQKCPPGQTPPLEHTGSVVIPARGPSLEMEATGSQEDGLQAEALGHPLPSGWLLLGQNGTTLSIDGASL